MIREVQYYDNNNNKVNYVSCASYLPERYESRLTDSSEAKNIKGYGYVYGMDDNGNYVRVNRVVEYKVKNPSKHVCGARCRGAKCHNCECECGGLYHGADA